MLLVHDDEPVEIGLRLQAARKLAGLRTPHALAEAIGERGFGEGVIRKIEQGTRPMERSEIAAAARACGVPESFFRAPLHRLGDMDAGDVAPVLPEEMEAILGELKDLRDDLVRSDVIRPRRGEAATQVAEEAARRRSAPSRRSAGAPPRRRGSAGG